MPSRSDSPARTERPIARSGEEYGVRTVHWAVRHAELAWWAPSQLSSRERLTLQGWRQPPVAQTVLLARTVRWAVRLVRNSLGGGSLQPWLGAWLPRPCSFCWLGWRFWVGALRMWRAGRILRGLRARTARRQRCWWPTRRAWTSRTATATRMPGTTRPLRRAFNFPAARLRWRAKAPRWKAPRSSSRKRAPTWCRASLKGRSWWKRQTT